MTGNKYHNPRNRFFNYTKMDINEEENAYTQEDYELAAESLPFCELCAEHVAPEDLNDTDCGMICSYCLRGIESRGEEITIYKRGNCL